MPPAVEWLLANPDTAARQPARMGWQALMPSLREVCQGDPVAEARSDWLSLLLETDRRSPSLAAHLVNRPGLSAYLSELARLFGEAPPEVRERLVTTCREAGAEQSQAEGALAALDQVWLLVAGGEQAKVLDAAYAILARRPDLFVRASIASTVYPKVVPAARPRSLQLVPATLVTTAPSRRTS